MTTSTGLTALAAVLAAVLAALLTQWATSRRERIERIYERRRAALLDAQDAALAVRNRLADFGRRAARDPGEADPGLLDAQVAMNDALSALDVRLTRVDDADVVGAVVAWRQQAEFTAISVEDVTAEQVQALWEQMNARFGAALRR